MLDTVKAGALFSLFLIYRPEVNGTWGIAVYGEGSVETEGSVASTTFFLQGWIQAMMRLIPIPVVPAPPLLPTSLKSTELEGERCMAIVELKPSH